MKITWKVGQLSGGMPAGDIPVGTVFDGSLSGYTGPFLRTYDSVVFLNDPKHTWHPTKIGWEISIENYQPLNAELVIHGPALPATS